jgi:hypothetical protein
MEHYFDNLNPVEFAQVQFNLENRKAEDKIFVGQGVTQPVGSDSYGYYVAEVFNNKFIALVSADSRFINGWQDGSMECTRPEDWQNKKTWCYFKKYGKKWYYANAEGKRSPGIAIKMHFYGAHAYRDPSF